MEFIRKQFKLLTQQDTTSFHIKFFRFFVLGGFVSIIDFSIFTILNNTLFQQNHLISNTISFTVGIFLSYYLSKQWIFNYKEKDFFRVFALFAVTSLIGLFISDAIIYALFDLNLLKNSLWAINYDIVDKKVLSSLAKIISMFVVLIWNFFTKNMIVFKKNSD